MVWWSCKTTLGRQNPEPRLGKPPINEIDGACSKAEWEAVDQRLRYSFVEVTTNHVIKYVIFAYVCGYSAKLLVQYTYSIRS